MFTSFLKITLRNLYREKMYALINIAGLSIAIACCIILGLWLRSELTYDHHNANYLSEKRLIKLVGSFGVICIFISCLGLFGLSAFTTEQRTKEIGIRKVLGASTWRIIRMLFRDIVFLVLIGAVLASLIAYFVMDEWLSSFAYRTGINPLVFIFSALLVAGVAFITVAMQSYKTARANPVDALRYE